MGEQAVCSAGDQVPGRRESLIFFFFCSFPAVWVGRNDRRSGKGAVVSNTRRGGTGWTGIVSAGVVFAYVVFCCIVFRYVVFCCTGEGIYLDFS